MSSRGLICVTPIKLGVFVLGSQDRDVGNDEGFYIGEDYQRGFHGFWTVPVIQQSRLAVSTALTPDFWHLPP